MGRTHSYEVGVRWTGDRGTGTSGYRDYGRDHDIETEGRPSLEGSADPTFRGDKSRWNPELFLVAALAECHMLSYLHHCAVAGVVVTGYADDALGSMEQEGNGGHFTEVVLRPRVTVASADMVDAAVRLHADAHRDCFIASSVNFPVRHEPTVRAEAVA